MFILIKTIIGWSAIGCGVFFTISSILGIIRFPDIYTRAHAAGINDSLGAPLLLLGLACLQADFFVSLKLICLAFTLLVLSPSSTHAIIKAAWLNNIRAYEKDEDGNAR